MTILFASGVDADERAPLLDALRVAMPAEHIVAAPHAADPGPAETIDIAIVAKPRPGSLRGLPRLVLIHSLWAGVDTLLRDDTLPAHVPIVRLVDPALTAAMAETALWAVLALHRGFYAYARRQREARWLPHRQRRADELCVAVLGQGRMGAEATRRIAAMGYRTIGWHTRAGALDDVLRSADIVVNLLPLTPTTHGLFDAARLALLPRGAGLVNLARGAHVIEADLLAALDAGHIRHAVLDVFTTEPLPAEHVFWRHPQVTVLPHVAALTDPRSAAQIVARNIAAFRRGEMPAPLVDRVRGY